MVIDGGMLPKERTNFSINKMTDNRVPMTKTTWVWIRRWLHRRGSTRSTGQFLNIEKLKRSIIFTRWCTPRTRNKDMDHGRVCVLVHNLRECMWPQWINMDMGIGVKLSQVVSSAIGLLTGSFWTCFRNYSFVGSVLPWASSYILLGIVRWTILLLRDSCPCLRLSIENNIILLLPILFSWSCLQTNVNESHSWSSVTYKIDLIVINDLVIWIICLTVS